MPAKAKQPQTRWPEWTIYVSAFMVNVIVLGLAVHYVTTNARHTTARQLYECQADKGTLQGRIDLLQERVDFRPVATQRMQTAYEISLSLCEASLERASHDILLCIPGKQ